jgi:hypothetical protein
MKKIRFLDENYTEVTEGNFDVADIKSLCEQLTKHCSYEPGNDLSEVVERIGGRITGDWPEYSILETGDCQQDDPTSQIASIFIRAKRDFLIFVPPIGSPERKRFSIAHELGHYVLHFLCKRVKNSEKNWVFPPPTFAHRFGDTIAEKEADWFAVIFLMPEDAFRNFWDDSSLSANDIAGRFGVSNMAVDLRAKTLGLDRK